MPTQRIKYPSTPHLPWSPQPGSEDIRLIDTAHFERNEVVITEKLDGENTSMYRDHIHARSLDPRPHPSRDWVKRIHGQIAYLIPEGWRLCGENMYAVHSIAYKELQGYFYLFSVWNDQNEALSWDETLRWAQLLGLPVPQTLYRGVWDEARVRALAIDPERMEGYVVRLCRQFNYSEFTRSVAKWVRFGHIQTDEHWMHRAVVANGLSGSTTDSSDPSV